jgi:hypothetical protein
MQLILDSNPKLLNRKLFRPVATLRISPDKLPAENEDVENVFSQNSIFCKFQSGSSLEKEDSTEIIY